MNKKEQQAFRELRDLCKKHSMCIGELNNRHEIMFRINGVGYFRNFFDAAEETIYDIEGVAHSISSEVVDK